jgi:ribA/ribD-fused uncharacterized protein
MERGDLVLDISHAFKDEFAFLSNMYPCEVWYEGVKYPSSENAYQAAKTLDPKIRQYISLLAPHKSKSVAAKNELFIIREDWDKVKRHVMLAIIKDKFMRNEDLKQMLLSTGDLELVEYNFWQDKYWGVYKGEGENWLGRILMHVRTLL